MLSTKANLHNHSQDSAQGAGHRVRGCVGEAHMMLGWLCVSWWNLLSNAFPSSSWLWNIQCRHQDWVPLVLSDNITCFSPDILPSPTHGTSDLVLWMLQERSSLSCCILYNRGSWVLAQLLSLSPAGESQADKFSLSSKLCCPWGGLMWHAHVVPLTHYSASFSLFSPEKYWNFSSGNLDFYKGSLVCG